MKFVSIDHILASPDVFGSKSGHLVKFMISAMMPSSMENKSELVNGSASIKLKIDNSSDARKIEDILVHRVDNSEETLLQVDTEKLKDRMNTLLMPLLERSGTFCMANKDLSNQPQIENIASRLIRQHFPRG